jgi:hypothetical protein
MLTMTTNGNEAYTMKRRAGMIGLAMMSLALGACGSDGTTTKSFTPQQLSDALLATSDLGAGWTETQRDVFTTRQPENPSIDPSLWCPAGKGDELAKLAGQEGADAELSTGTRNSPYMVRQQAWTNADVEQYFSSVKAAVAACSGVTWNDGDGNSYTLQPLTTAPKIGDESVSWEVLIKLNGTTPMTTIADQTAGRFGNVMMVLQGGANQTAGPGATAPNYVPIVRAAGNKMAGLVTP